MHSPSPPLPSRAATAATVARSQPEPFPNIAHHSDNPLPLPNCDPRRTDETTYVTNACEANSHVQMRSLSNLHETDVCDYLFCLKTGNLCNKISKNSENTRNSTLQERREPTRSFRNIILNRGILLTSVRMDIGAYPANAVEDWLLPDS